MTLPSRRRRLFIDTWELLAEHLDRFFSEIDMVLSHFGI